MMDILKKYKLVLLVGGGLLLMVFGYQTFFAGGSGTSTTATTQNSGTATVVNNERVGIEQELLSQLLELRSITLDDRVFSNPAFRSLQDFSQPIEPEPVGRPNPFAPVAIVASSPSTATSSNSGAQE